MHPFHVRLFMIMLVLSSPSSGGQLPARLETRSPKQASKKREARPAALVQFVDVARKAGLHFKHWNGASPEKYVIETMGSGVAFLDYNNDGLLDIYLVNGGTVPGHASPGPIRNALYRNNGDGTFTDVTDAAGVAGGGWSTSAAFLDYDRDGRLDLFVARYVNFDF